MRVKKNLMGVQLVGEIFNVYLTLKDQKSYGKKLFFQFF